jgi:hypothetical protein
MGREHIVKVRCPWCPRRRLISIRGDGTLYVHKPYSNGYHGTSVSNCEGSGKHPDEHPGARG